jgi:hypothetical protein
MPAYFKRKPIFLLASLKTLTNSDDCSESRALKFIFWLSFALFGQFSPVYIYDRLSEKFSGSRAAFGTTFRVPGCYWKAGTISRTCLLKIFSQLVVILQKQAETLF